MLLADDGDDAHLAQAVDHLLREPSRTGNGGGEVGSGEWFANRRRDDGEEVSRMMETGAIDHVDQSSFFGDPAVPSPAARFALASHLFLVGQQNLHLKVGVAEEAREGDKFGEHVV